jgi:hypothetical protein
LSILLVIGIIALLLVLCIRRSPKPREIVQSLSPADRNFVADHIEPITKLPLDTTADVDAWVAATHTATQRLKEHFPEGAWVMPEQVYHYFDDVDIHWKEPAYRAASEARVLEFIGLLREKLEKT